MFDKMKANARKVKDWAIDHKGEIAMTVVGIGIGVLGGIQLQKNKDAGFDPEALNFLSNVSRGNPNHGYDVYDTRGMSIETLTDRIERAHAEDATVVGALVYTKGK